MQDVNVEKRDLALYITYMTEVKDKNEHIIYTLECMYVYKMILTHVSHTVSLTEG